MAAALCATGMQMAACYKKRIAFWETMEKMADRFATEIRFTADSPEKIFRRLTDSGRADTLQKQPEPEGSFIGLFAREIRRMSEPLALSETALAPVYEFGQGLGTTDLEGQLSLCACYGRIFAEKTARAKEEYNTHGKLNRSLCVLASAAIAIVLL